jgi:hypothetical protein
MEAATEIRSARLIRHLKALHAAASGQLDKPALPELAADIDAFLASAA